MKVLNEHFTDEEFESLKDLKDGLSWHDFILKMVDECKKNKRIFTTTK